MALPIIIVTILFIAMMVFPWISFPLLLLVPTLKASAEFYVPFFQRVDLTVLACGMAAVAALWNMVRRTGSGTKTAVPWRTLVLLGVLGCVLAMGLLWTTAPSYGLRKVYRFIGIGIPYLVLPTLLVRSPRDGKAMILMVAFAGTLTAVAILVVPRSYLDVMIQGRTEIRTTILGSSPIMLAVVSGFGLLAALSGFMITGSASRPVRYAALLVLPLALMAILKTGTRSAAVGLLITATLLPLLAGRFGRIKGVFILTVAIPVCAVAGFLFIRQTAYRTADRWAGIAQVTSAAELGETRLDHYAFCLTHAWSRPLLGHGPGSFAVDKVGWDEPNYPHNIFLEALYEAGLVGLIALAMFFVVALRTGFRGIRISATPEDRLLVIGPFSLFLMMSVQSMMHWDLDGVRFLYLFAGLLHANVTLVEQRCAFLNPAQIPTGKRTAARSAGALSASQAFGNGLPHRTR